MLKEIFQAVMQFMTWYRTCFAGSGMRVVPEPAGESYKHQHGQ